MLANIVVSFNCMSMTLSNVSIVSIALTANDSDLAYILLFVDQSTFLTSLSA